MAIAFPEIRTSHANSFFYHGEREGWHVALGVNRDSAPTGTSSASRSSRCPMTSQPSTSWPMPSSSA